MAPTPSTNSPGIDVSMASMLASCHSKKLAEHALVELAFWKEQLVSSCKAPRNLESRNPVPMHLGSTIHLHCKRSKLRASTKGTIGGILSAAHFPQLRLARTSSNTSTRHTPPDRGSSHFQADTNLPIQNAECRSFSTMMMTVRPSFQQFPFGTAAAKSVVVQHVALLDSKCDQRAARRTNAAHGLRTRPTRWHCAAARGRDATAAAAEPECAVARAIMEFLAKAQDVAPRWSKQQSLV
ncbi:hypothetical protein FI667_g5596, partial [Globisporangium splendens]